MTERAKYWSDLVTAWSQSGLSQAEFCRQRGVKVASLTWWKRQLHKLRGDAPKDGGRLVKAKAGKGFVEVRLTGMPSAPTYEVLLARGRSIRVPAQFDPQILSRLIAAVESC
jgi:hypothetical protein